MTGGLEKLSSSTFFVLGKLRECFFPFQKGFKWSQIPVLQTLETGQKEFLRSNLEGAVCHNAEGEIYCWGKINFGFSSALRDELEIESLDSLFLLSHCS